MSKIKWKGGALLGPIPPVMVTCGDMEKSNIITIGWTGIINTVPPKTYISVRPTRYSYDIIKNSGEFVINLTTVDMVRNADYLGTYTGRKIDKFARSGLTKEKASEVACPVIAESPLALECKVFDIIPLGSHDMFLADIVAVDVDEDLIDREGRLHLDRAHLAAFAHGEYFELGKKIGNIGFAIKKKKHKQNGKANKTFAENNDIKNDSAKKKTVNKKSTASKKPSDKKKGYPKK